ncbi:MAG: CbtB-domain containing protein [Rhodospirillales bacterium]|nr:CbtB-domain containing protein [Rhodospirillales bacterium]
MNHSESYVAEKTRFKAVPQFEAAHERSQATVPVILAVFLGLFMLVGVGFAQVSHDSAHDSRHSFAFPCH